MILVELAGAGCIATDAQSAAIAWGHSPDASVRATGLAAIRTLAYLIACDASSIVDVFCAERFCIQTGKVRSFFHCDPSAAKRGGHLVRNASRPKIVGHDVTNYAGCSWWAVRLACADFPAKCVERGHETSDPDLSRAAAFDGRVGRVVGNGTGRGPVVSRATVPAIADDWPIGTAQRTS